MSATHRWAAETNSRVVELPCLSLQGQARRVVLGNVRSHNTRDTLRCRNVDGRLLKLDQGRNSNSATNARLAWTLPGSSDCGATDSQLVRAGW